MKYLQLDKCTVLKYSPRPYCDFETWFRGHSRSPEMILFDRWHMSSCYSSIVTMTLSCTVFVTFDFEKYWFTPMIVHAGRIPAVAVDVNRCCCLFTVSVDRLLVDWQRYVGVV